VYQNKFVRNDFFIIFFQEETAFIIDYATICLTLRCS